MAKGQKRGNKEIRKPKKDKQAKAAEMAGNASPLKIVESGGFSAKKKK
jgi:hypothetical protein